MTPTQLRHLITEQLREIEDVELLDFIHKLLIHES